MKKEILAQLQGLRDMIIDGEDLQLQSKSRRSFIVEHNKNLLEGLQIIKETVEYIEENNVECCGHISNN